MGCALSLWFSNGYVNNQQPESLFSHLGLVWLIKWSLFYFVYKGVVRSGRNYVTMIRRTLTREGTQGSTAKTKTMILTLSFSFVKIFAICSDISLSTEMCFKPTSTSSISFQIAINSPYTKWSKPKSLGFVKNIWRSGHQITKVSLDEKIYQELLNDWNKMSGCQHNFTHCSKCGIN